MPESKSALPQKAIGIGAGIAAALLLVKELMRSLQGKKESKLEKTTIEDRIRKILGKSPEADDLILGLQLCGGKKIDVDRRKHAYGVFTEHCRENSELRSLMGEVRRIVKGEF